MLNYKLPLTAEESAFAMKNHDLIKSYLRKRHLSINEYYDIAVFGYLRAVRKYLARPELQQYEFSTIANRAMSCDIYHSWEYWKRAKRDAEILPFREERNFDDLRDITAEAMDNIVDFQQLIRTITPRQRRIAGLRADGYRDKEIAAILRVSVGEVTAEMEDAKCRVLNFQAEDAADMVA